MWGDYNMNKIILTINLFVFIASMFLGIIFLNNGMIWLGLIWILVAMVNEVQLVIKVNE
jgi:hypothetical protein